MIAVTAIPEAGTRRELERILESTGWSVYHALNSDDVQASCVTKSADVVLIDVAFPGGAEHLLDRIKTDPDLFRTAVVIIGAGFDTAYVARVMDRGASDVLRKPLDPGDVVGRSRAAARTKALVSELTEQQTHLEELVLFDELTGLRNRRAVLSDLDQMLASAHRHGHGFAVLMIDIDRFKPINDEHGHRVGDEVLREVTARLEARLRSADVAGRIGGDELLVLLPETDAEGALVLAESIRGAIACKPFVTSMGALPVTVSLGSAAWDHEDATRLLERADLALYAAKDAGRDRAATA
jgi:two-component system cell cycle response regulator